MKISRYNVPVDTDSGDVLLFNCLSSALVRVSASTYQQVRDGALSLLPGDVISGLIGGGFIVPSELDEVELCRHKADVNRYMCHEVNIVILPTTHCNFACPYCFSRAAPAVMSDEVADELCRFVSRRTKLTRNLKVEWFGGEPLLALDRVLSLSSTLADMAERDGCRYSSTMVSNGFLLDRATAVQLQSAGIRHVQITLDGPEHIHNQTRIARDRKPTFQRIWDNIVESSQVIQVLVRINSSPDTYEQAWSLYEEFVQTGLTERVSVYIALLHDRDAVTPDHFNLCYSGDSFMGKFFADIRSRLQSGDGMPGMTPPFPSFAVGCMARQPLSAAIGPQGDLYKCSKIVGQHEFKVGSLFDRGPEATLLPGALDWHRQEPLCLECSDCTFLPVCNGGCPAEWFLNGRRRCRQMEEFFPEIIIAMELFYGRNKGVAV